MKAKLYRRSPNMEYVAPDSVEAVTVSSTYSDYNHADLLDVEHTHGWAAGTSSPAQNMGQWLQVALPSGEDHNNLTHFTIASMMVAAWWKYYNDNVVQVQVVKNDDTLVDVSTFTTKVLTTHVIDLSGADFTDAKAIRLTCIASVVQHFGFAHIVGFTYSSDQISELKLDSYSVLPAFGESTDMAIDDSIYTLQLPGASDLSASSTWSGYNVSNLLVENLNSGWVSNTVDNSKGQWLQVAIPSTLDRSRTKWFIIKSGGESEYAFPHQVSVKLVMNDDSMVTVGNFVTSATTEHHVYLGVPEFADAKAIRFTAEDNGNKYFEFGYIIGFKVYELMAKKLKHEVKEIYNLLEQIGTNISTKSDLNALMGTFNTVNLKGVKDSVESLQAIEQPQNGDAWFVGPVDSEDKELYVYTDSGWEMFGYSTIGADIDTSTLYTNEEIDTALATNKSTVETTVARLLEPFDTVHPRLGKMHLVSSTETEDLLELSISADKKQINIPSTQAVSSDGNLIVVPEGTYTLENERPVGPNLLYYRGDTGTFGSLHLNNINPQDRTYLEINDGPYLTEVRLNGRIVLEEDENLCETYLNDASRFTIEVGGFYSPSAHPWSNIISDNLIFYFNSASQCSLRYNNIDNHDISAISFGPCLQTGTYARTTIYNIFVKYAGIEDPILVHSESLNNTDSRKIFYLRDSADMPKVEYIRWNVDCNIQYTGCNGIGVYATPLAHESVSDLVLLGSYFKSEDNLILNTLGNKKYILGA